MDSLKA